MIHPFTPSERRRAMQPVLRTAVHAAAIGAGAVAS